VSSDDPMPTLVARWRASRTGPDLQELIAAFGNDGYRGIPAYAWPIWDAEVEEYRTRLRSGTLPGKAAKPKAPEPDSFRAGHDAHQTAAGHHIGPYLSGTTTAEPAPPAQGRPQKAVRSPFLHPCAVCGKDYAPFGFNGTYYCPEHRPQGVP
jgi:hypothetical protein